MGNAGSPVNKLKKTVSYLLNQGGRISQEKIASRSGPIDTENGPEAGLWGSEGFDYSKASAILAPVALIFSVSPGGRP